MKTKLPIFALTLATLSFAPILDAANTPRPVANVTDLANKHTGLVAGPGWTGSGVVARHPKVMVSCAHVGYDSSAGTYRALDFHIRHNNASAPRYGTGHRLRGYYRWTNYANNARTYGSNDARTFNLDLIAAYSHANFDGGRYAGWWHDGRAMLTSNSSYKLVTGYPVARTRNYRMHYTGYFQSPFGVWAGRYLWNNTIGVGGGNSGGPVWAWHSQSRNWLLAGILVSGAANSTYGTGVVGLDSSAQGLLNDAAARAGSLPTTTTRSFSVPRSVGIADASRVWQRIRVPVSGMGSSLTNARFSIDIRHPYKGDLRVYLQSPRGRTIAIHNRTGGSADNVIISNRNVTSSFRGVSPNGNWTLFVADVASGDVGYLRNFSLSFTTR